MNPVFTQRLHPQTDLSPHYILALTAEERTRSRLHVRSEEGTAVHLQLPRGNVLRDGDWLRSENGEIAQIHAKPEPVLTVTTLFPLALLQAAYHLGHRNIPLEITSCFLRLSPDPTLSELLKQRGLQVLEEVAPFQPEINFNDGLS
ncbi:urease accessory protein UreE [Romeriopsis navalis]|uniref:urease accessory protein UreE n=1 Tax=Romeriopsis navalis TaxID=2992132 RepID=UPI0021F8CDD4|nr:urease accessory protein UreE [Romeriopsis navalis]